MRADHAAGTVTPEAVHLDADVAGLGSRTLAFIVDTVIQALLLIPVFLVPLGDGLSGPGETVIVVVLFFVILWCYYPAFEFGWRGQTPGKRVQGIRVVRTNGQPAGFAPILVRNLIRSVEVMLLPFVAIISMFVTRRSQRLGDLAAGTMVIRERKLPAPGLLDLNTMWSPSAQALDTSGLNERDYTVLRTFLLRRADLDDRARQELAYRLAKRIREVVGEPPGDRLLTDEQLIESAAQSYRSRFSDRSG